jgi:acyl transferase domain-containing protein
VSPQLFTLSAQTPTELEKATDALVGRLEAGQESPTEQSALAFRRVVVADSGVEAAGLLRDRRTKEVFTEECGLERSVVFMFSGVGDQYPGMASGLYRLQPVFRRELDRCVRLLEPEIGVDLRELLFPSADSASARPSLADLFDQREVSQEIHRTRVAQPLAFAVQYAMARSLLAVGVRPHALVGYSLGEYVAGCLAGVFSLEDALHLTALRARLVDAQPRGAMLAVSSAPDALEPLLSESVSIAAFNGPELTVLAGFVDEIERLRKLLLGREIACSMLATAHAFHSPMMDPVVGPLRKEFAGVSLSPPTLPVLSNVTGTWMKDTEATDPGFWADHAREPIRFNDDLAELWRLPAPIPVELGPGRTLTNLAVRHPGCRDGGQHTALRTLPGVFESHTDLSLFLTAVGRLWATGVDVDLSALDFDEVSEGEEE